MSLLPSAGYSEGSRRFDQWGHGTPAPSFRKIEAGGYLEYGVTPTFDLVLAPTLSRAHDGGATNTVTGSDSSALGGRLALFQVPGSVVAVQVLVQPPLGREAVSTQLADGGARAPAVDARLMLGHGFSVFHWPAFVDVDPGVRFRTYPFPDETRLDATFGVRPWTRLMVLAQSFSSFAPPFGALVPRTSSTKLQGSLVYDLSARWSAQVGGFHTFSGRNVVRETGPFIAAWCRF